MLVQLLTSTPNPEKVVAAAAKLCYSDSSIEQLLDQEAEQAEKLLRKILDLGHMSVLEHASFTFGIEGVSRACSHQLVRHRLASFSQQSQRYVAYDKPCTVVIPKSVKAHPELAEKFESHIQGSHDLYCDLMAAGVPAEDARFILPNAASTKLVMTMNARELRHFFELRCCNRAQWEIRAMAKEMLTLLRRAAPILFADAGPGCLHGPCPEGPMTCGEIKAVREEYARL